MTKRAGMLTAAFVLSLQSLLVLLPIQAVLYLSATGAASTLFEDRLAHTALVALSVALGALVAAVTWACYRHSREPVLRWLTLSFLAFTAIYLPHGLLTPHAAADPWMFLLFGPTARVTMTAFLVIGLVSWGSPADATSGQARLWGPSLAMIAAASGLTCLLAATPWAPTARLVGEINTILLCLAAAGVITARRILSPLMKIYLGAVALFAQASFTFILSTPWTHLWWLAHLIFNAGFLLLGYGVARAYLTTRSFTKIYSEREMIARLDAATAEAAAARDTAMQLRRLFTAQPLGVVVLAPGGGEIFSNQRLAAMTARVKPPESLSRALATAIAARPEAQEVELSLSGAEPLYYIASWLPLRFAGEDATVVWLYDVSELKAAVAAAQRANTAKSRFLAAASHDIRQPLVPIKLFAELLEAEVTEPTSVDLVRKMRSSMQSLDDLLSRLLDFSRLEAGGVQPRRGRVPLGPILTRLRHEFEPVATACKLSLSVVDSSAVVTTDHVLLEEILRNLMENALRYTARGKVLVGCRRRGARISLWVADTGIGIPESQQAAVFNEFFQIGNQHRNRRHGLGLGLATVDRLGRLLGHDIGLRSAPGKGSVFSVTMDLVTRPSRRLPAGRKADLARSRMPHVLLIEDDDGAREAVTLALGTWGWQVTTAASCAEALAAVETFGAPHIIVSDLRLEAEHSGLDAIRIVAQACDSDIPAVIVTGDNTHPDLAAANAGPWPVLLKPFSARELRATVANVLGLAG